MSKETTQKAEGYDFGSYEKDTLTRPRDAAWDNFHSWEKAEPGDKVQGYIEDAFYRPEELNDDGSVAFKPQRGITLRQTNGELVNITIKFLDFILKKTDGLRVGDPLTIVFEKQLQPKQKGWKGAKVFGYYGKNLDTTVGNPTVKHLTDEDRKVGGTKVDEEEVPAVTSGSSEPDEAGWEEEQQQ
jgi:hypothetical protein